MKDMYIYIYRKIEERERKTERPVWRGVSGFCGRQMTVAYLPGPAAILLLRSDLRRRPRTRGGKKRRGRSGGEREREIPCRCLPSRRWTRRTGPPLELIDRLSTSPGFVEWKKYGSRRYIHRALPRHGTGRDGTGRLV